ncbi:hypothetical protein PJK45_13480 [Mycobacterium kansasii]|nr:hypothetical protein [Mycobacterium kansasii]MXO39528.1 hypothetical protein [Mycobacterium kansasii]UCA18638.1 hypothetical protein LA359_21010 [Mycobacterium kansasii]UGT83497.1 hypothetical protein LTS70_13050 [Mycobacterium kansasii]UGT87772.1 hypothetical protein LTT71_06445 [Mycobacterium kansasii]UGU23963.1 hypothetical protein LT351_21045 [Mycobacterium kansasii]
MAFFEVSEHARPANESDFFYDNHHGGESAEIIGVMSPAGRRYGVLDAMIFCQIPWGHVVLPDRVVFVGVERAGQPTMACPPTASARSRRSSSKYQGLSSEGRRGGRLLCTQLDTIAAGITASADLLCPMGKELVDQSVEWLNEADQAPNRCGRQTGYPATPALPASPTGCQSPRLAGELLCSG